MHIDRYLSDLSSSSGSSSAGCSYFDVPSLICMHKDLGIDVTTAVAEETSVDSFEDEVQAVRMFPSSGRIWDIRCAACHVRWFG